MNEVYYAAAKNPVDGKQCNVVEGMHVALAVQVWQVETIRTNSN